MTTAADQRTVTRLACSLPVRLQPAGGAALQATVLDMSREGARLRVPGAQLGVYRLAPLGFVAKRVGATLGEAFEAVLCPDRLGSVVTKTLRPVRIGHRDGSLADVELGCMMTPPLSDLEAAMLQLPLPMLKADGSESQARLEVPELVVRPTAPRGEPAAAPPPARPAPAAPAAPRPPAPLRAPPPVQVTRRPAEAAAPPPPSAPAPAPAPTADAPLPAPAASRTGAVPSTAGRTRPGGRPGLSGWRAYVHPSGERRVPPFLAAAETISSQGVLLRVMDRASLSLTGPSDVASTVVSFDHVYGSQVALKLSDGPTHLWTGPARIEEVEVPGQNPQQVLLWLSFGRALRPAELRALGLE